MAMAVSDSALGNSSRAVPARPSSNDTLGGSPYSERLMHVNYYGFCLN